MVLMPYAAVPTGLAQFQAEAEAAGVPPPMTYEVLGKSAQGRDIYGVVINALEGPGQMLGYERWLSVAVPHDVHPVGAEALLASYGNDVKMVAYQSHIHGNEWEAVDSNMQVIRDLTVTPSRRESHGRQVPWTTRYAVVLMDNNPDGRVNGTRGNPTGLDPNRDFLVQSQPEQQIAVAYMHRWLPTGVHRGSRLRDPYFHRRTCTGTANPGARGGHVQRWNVQRIEQNRARLCRHQDHRREHVVPPIRD